MINTISYHLSRWPKVLIIGSIHWNEPCGSIAIWRIIQKINNGWVILNKWIVTFLQVANPLASNKNMRFVDENLARIFDMYDNPSTYEQKLSNLIVPIVQNNDFILDVHSGNAKGSKFIFQDYEEKEYYDLANALWFDMVVHWRSNIYEWNQWWDVTSFAYKLGIPSVVIECWQHNDPDAVAIAEQAIMRFLSYYWIIDGLDPIKVDTKHLMMQKLYKMEFEWTFQKDRKHWDFIREWEIIAEYKQWWKIIANEDCYIILPKHFAKPWDEWFYLWVEQTNT